MTTSARSPASTSPTSSRMCSLRRRRRVQAPSYPFAGGGAAITSTRGACAAMAATNWGSPRTSARTRWRSPRLDSSSRANRSAPPGQDRTASAASRTSRRSVRRCSPAATGAFCRVRVKGARARVQTMDWFEGRAAVVTGAARGIGEATVRQLAELGARVVAVDVDGDALHTAFPDDGVARVVGDLGGEDTAGLAAQSVDDHGPRTLLVNNVGIDTHHDFLGL